MKRRNGQQGHRPLSLTPLVDRIETNHRIHPRIARGRKEYGKSSCAVADESPTLTIDPTLQLRSDRPTLGFRPVEQGNCRIGSRALIASEQGARPVRYQGDDAPGRKRPTENLVVGPVPDEPVHHDDNRCGDRRAPRSVDRRGQGKGGRIDGPSVPDDDREAAEVLRIGEGPGREEEECEQSGDG